ncbi:MAG: sigma-54 dependent transcriptional regulator [Ignavibacteria bacterium]|nr:sigma-54 dependent transcriptional regulator [Ignavibacteria bacterium]
MKANILVVDDELVICQSCEKIFLKAGHNVSYTTSGNKALQILDEKNFDVIFTDLKMTDIGGMELLQAVKQKYPDTIVVVITGYATVASAVETMRYGAFDYLPKPFTPAEILTVLNRALEKRNLVKIIKEEYNYSDLTGFEGIIGKSPSILRVYNLINKVAPTDSTVLILGESGTGKELTARAIHNKSKRREGKFFPIDISSLSSNLIESELFGHLKGSFTGAITDKQGVFESAEKGTIFLDEIGNLPLDIQSKLLRFLQEKEYLPVGSTKIKKADARLIFATNQNLKGAVEERKFREDLYYRLNVFPIKLPPLRERKEDIPELTIHFLKKYCTKLGKEILKLDIEAIEMLQNYQWPGNIRELENIIERLSILVEEGEIKSINISSVLFRTDPVANFVLPKNIYDLNNFKKQIKETSIKEVEKLFITEALLRNNFNITKASLDVSMQRSNFQAMMKKYGIKKPNE